jgi:predicted RNase H-like nuclease (RuvC/YqgF family)
MKLKPRSLYLLAWLGLALGVGVFATPGTRKLTPPVKKANANGQKTGKWAQDKSACKALNSQAKELLTQEKQLHTQAREKEAEEKALLAQSKQIEMHRVAEEHSLRKGQNNAAAEARIKAQEQQRVNLEHEAKEKSKECEALNKQADELGKQRAEVEQQHKQECQFGKEPKPVK